VSENLINAFKTSLACIIGFIFAHLFNLHSSQWMIITTLVVMSSQTYIGGALQKSYLRFIGTFFGAFIAIITLFFYKENNYVLYTVIILSVFCFTYTAKFWSGSEQAFTLGAVTVAIILLSPEPNIHTALIRFFEILLGIIIALSVHILIFPMSATRKLNHLISDNFSHTLAYFKSITERNSDKNDEFEKLIMSNFIITQKLFTESKTELIAKKKKRYNEIIFHQKRLFRAISLLDPYLKKKPIKLENINQEYPLISEMITKLSQGVLVSKKENAKISEELLHDSQISDKHYLIQYILREIKALLKLV